MKYDRISFTDYGIVLKTMPLFMSKEKESEKGIMKEKKKMSLAMQIFIALVLAIAAGLLLQRYAQFAETYIKPFGTIFLNLLKFIVVPIVLFSIMCGIISMRDIKKFGAIGLKTVVYYMCTTAFAITFGLIGGNLFKKLFPVIATTDLSYEIGEKTSLMDTIVNIFPSNFISPMVEANMLQVIVMAILIGFAIILVGDEKNDRIITACNDLNDIFMKCMEMILKLSPVGVFCLLCPVVAANGATIIGSLAMVLLAAYVCYVIHAVIVYSLAVKTLGGISPVLSCLHFQVRLLLEHFLLIWSVQKNWEFLKRFRLLFSHWVQQLTWMVLQSIRGYVQSSLLLAMESTLPFHKCLRSSSLLL